MYFVDHNPPHFHADYQGFKAEYDIQTLKLLNGGLPKRAHALVLEWASLRREELMEDWNLASVPATLKNIHPLD